MADRLKIRYSFPANDDLARLAKENSRLVMKLTEMIDYISRNPEDPLYGKGSPKRLKHSQEPVYSREISPKHRLV